MSQPNLPSEIENRKSEHLRVCIEEDVEFQQLTNGLEKYRFTHCCLPELDRSDIELGTTFLGKSLKAPILISSMTGGTELAHLVNTRLATVAQRYGLAMGVGSQRIALEQPELAPTFAVRSLAPDILLLANLGAVQLNYSCGLEDCLKLVELLEADALILHLNPLQEWVQSEGDSNFKGLLAKIEQICAQLPVPVIAKEVGNGISAVMAKKLIEAGVAAIDVAGAGGTSWAKVESQRAKDNRQRHLGQVFADWGLPTAECITAIRSLNSTIPLIASGGLKNGLDIAKSIALGADLGGLARPFLVAAIESEAAVDELVKFLIAELEIVLFCTGNPNLSALKHSGALKPC
ncbi:MAG: type 2 isopentenyl-diphosphate Delta-isomerase [Microcystis sp. M_OC_Ca_00000000_S217Cul]|jgi:isopentenyl-diphosphate delta-isomerase|uniref:Isopentenyl-diphosphate delta-isomerase n=1 Tax=Microcystis aeruginosa Ma_MB_S_20031200_S102 TaxID=2486254 RepID=A0A552ELQ5_MICAE|nr:MULTISPECIES: type 2 isopentenyl-diphosphate Delta-isomerase [Microcystis]NCS24956.1 type 2 isopentenyl-diphosphate Delta-isomerase [Microcystis aeruginosa BS13-02]TRU26885.1 MAG: type 2 isopentenyl-diphosphate Delta-isomerase [Microcystis aeruginosa Ma_MB_S_20031200_S102D]TRU35394.1 MAG: type 2 isopentenyl-diphosphate Delta-isomerase [Microcystis aeruginosa Ma_MB_S_20031200_S102]MDB9507217.1 type 2 isopentenyl-diphosphate Delta-isomerase [Microcystis aeruginosa CS-338/01]TRT79417.1 MAG: ty